MKFKVFLIIVLSLFCLRGVSQEHFLPDSTINGIFILSNPKSFLDFYKESSKTHLQDEISSYNPFGYSFIAFVNKDTSQYLISFEFDGDVTNSYSAFEIGYVTTDFFRCIDVFYVTEYRFFSTESGIFLNMPSDQLLELKGKNCCIKNNNTINYYLDDNSLFCMRYKQYKYFLKCEVNNGKVSKINFGFIYP